MPLTGKEVIAAVRAQQSETVLAFSTGKDALATWLAIRDHFDAVHPYFLYLVPDLEFVEESLAYYEKFFGVHITRLPHPSLHKWLVGGVCQPPERVAVLMQAEIPLHTYDDIRSAMVRDRKLDAEILVADGVRAADSPMRRISLMKHGAISYAQHRYRPIWDWNKADIVAAFQKARVKLPIDYRVFGRTFDGLDSCCR
jgi:3'-phosphoadenosine 5'-phosphosulfate sulfotransferase (PAPS reductase)/FAD synthetase